MMKDTHGHKARLLGWEVSHLSSAQQVILIAGGSIFFNLLYGCLQEYLVVNVFERQYGLLLSVLQTFSFAICAYAQRVHLGEAHSRRIPLRWYFLIALAQGSAMALGNIGMMHLNYAAKVLFKSTKAFPMMLWGALFLNRSYQIREYISVATMVIGLVLFLEADVLSPAIFSVLGVILMVCCVFMDCCYSNLAELFLKKYDATPEEVIFYTYMGGGMYQLSSSLFSGELVNGVKFLYMKGDLNGLYVIIIYGIAGYFGASCSTALTKNFGALNSALASATRKALNLLLSFMFFPKPFTLMHFCGVSLFMTGLITQSYWQKSKLHNKYMSVEVCKDSDEESVDTFPPSSYNSPGESERSSKKILDSTQLQKALELNVMKKKMDSNSSILLMRNCGIEEGSERV